MNSVVCTIFEGNYHYGVAGLVNSLFHSGFRGTVYVGYRGDLPSWAFKRIKNAEINGIKGDLLNICSELSLFFLTLNTERHLANFKPDFIFKISQSVSTDTEFIFYFDPDIVIHSPWSIFEGWVTDSLALCEDINPSFNRFHPIRKGWKQYFKKYNLDLPIDNDIYVNSGFLGFPRDASSFLTEWKNILQVMEKEDVDLASFSAVNHDLFSFPDQDALNVTLMREHYPLCVAGQEAMAFKDGPHYMFHAAGSPKPWNKSYLWYALNGIPPSLADKAYWSNTEYPIPLYSKAAFFWHRLRLKIASGIGRFIRRS